MLSLDCNRYVVTFSRRAYSFTYIGGDTMKVFEIAKFYPNIAQDRKLGEILFLSKMRMRKKFYRDNKEPKGNAKDGSYCPKNKFGQSWAYTKETNKEEEED